jgi:hypothetical protein
MRIKNAWWWWAVIELKMRYSGCDAEDMFNVMLGE